MVRHVFFACICLSGFVGCESTPSSSDPNKGREVLQRALDSWKTGEPVEALQSASPAITFVDFQRQKGWKLIAFEIDANSTPSGFDIQFISRLTLQSPDGKQTKQRARYNVSTTSKLVVVRSDEA